MFFQKYSKLLLANSLSYFGDSIFFYIAPLFIYDKTQSLASAATLSLFSVLPKFVFSIAGHALNMKNSPKTMMILIDFISSIAFIASGIFLVDSTPSLIFCFIFFINLLEALYKAPSRTIISSLGNISEEEIESFHKINNSISEVLNILGPVVGVFLYTQTKLGISGICFVNGISFLMASLLEWNLDVKANLHSKNKAKFFNYFFDLVIVLKNNSTLSILVFIMSMNGILGAYKIQLLSYSKIYTKEFYSYLLIAEGLGGATCFLIKSKFLKGWTGSLLIFVLLGLVMTTFSIVQNVYTLLAVTYITGLSTTLVTSNLYTLILTRFDERLASATISTVFAVGLLSIPFGGWLTSLGAEDPKVLTVIGLLLFITGSIFYVFTRHHFNNSKAKPI